MELLITLIIVLLVGYMGLIFFASVAALALGLVVSAITLVVTTVSMVVNKSIEALIYTFKPDKVNKVNINWDPKFIEDIKNLKSEL